MRPPDLPHGPGGPPPDHGPQDIPGLTVAAQARLHGGHAAFVLPVTLLTDREELLFGVLPAPSRRPPRVLTGREVTLLAVRLEAL